VVLVFALANLEKMAIDHIVAQLTMLVYFASAVPAALGFGVLARRHRA
jgi:hypothetical protein